MRHKAFLTGKDLPEQYALPFQTVQVKSERLDQPLRWKKPRLVFCNSVSDFHHPDIPTDILDAALAVMALTPRHTYQVLTKRAEGMLEYHNAPDLRERVEVAAGEFVQLALGESGQAAYRAARATGDFYITHTWPLPQPMARRIG